MSKEELNKNIETLRNEMIDAITEETALRGGRVPLQNLVMFNGESFARITSLETRNGTAYAYMVECNSGGEYVDTPLPDDIVLLSLNELYEIALELGIAPE